MSIRVLLFYACECALREGRFVVRVCVCVCVRTCVRLSLVAGRVDNIRSGWKNILVVLGTAAGDARTSLVELGYSVAESLVKDHFAKIRGEFVDMVRSFLLFAISVMCSCASAPPAL